MTLVIRASSTPSWADCSRRTAARSFRSIVLDAGYTLRDLPVHVGARVGTATHAGAALIVEGKLATGGSLPAVSDAIDYAVETFGAGLNDDGGTLWDATTDRVDTAQKQLARMVRSYYSDVAPKVEPTAIEKRLEATVSEGVVLSGQADVFTMVPGGLRDTKTGTLRRANAAQYGCYTLLADTHGHDVQTITEDFIRRVPLRKEQPLAEAHAIDPVSASQEALALIEDMVRSVRRFEDRVENGGAPHLALRANPMSSLCGEKWCPAWGTKFCTAHLGAK